VIQTFALLIYLQVVLALGVRDLPRMDWLSDTDPIVALFVTGR
jgi:hypothetical protein